MHDKSKQAFIITAYRDFEWIRQTVNLYCKEVDCYLHIDRKVKIPHDFIKWADNTKGVYVYSKYKINWGSYRHISAVLYLLDKAMQNGPYRYFHIMSADSFITRPMKELVNFFEENAATIFMELIDLEKEDPDGAIKPWYMYYHFLHLYNKRTTLGNNIDYYLGKIQKKLKIERKITYRYKGLLYCSLPVEAVSYSLRYIKEHPEYVRNLKYCNIGEEFFFQNILGDQFAASIYPKHLFYLKWNEGGVSQYIDEDDLEKLKKDEYLFARKFDTGSERSLEYIQRFLDKNP